MRRIIQIQLQLLLPLSHPQPLPPKKLPPPKSPHPPSLPPHKQERIKIQIRILHPQLSPSCLPVPHPHPQFVAAKSLILFPPGKIFNYNIQICKKACLCYLIFLNFIVIIIELDIPDVFKEKNYGKN